MAKVFFSRIHLDLFDENLNKYKNVFLLDGLRSDVRYQYRDYAYRISNVESDDKYITGYLVKYDPKGRGEFFEEETGLIKNGGTINGVIAKSLFIIDIKEMIIAFKENSNYLTKPTFLKIIRELFAINQKGKEYDFEISTISEKYSFIEKVKEINSISKVSITLFPSNPSNADLWRSIDERLQENNISRYKESQESLKGKEGIVIDEITNAKFAMSEDGYGQADVVGKDKNGIPISITTKHKTKEITEVLPNNIEKQGFKSIINYLSKTFNKIKQRTIHQ